MAINNYQGKKFNKNQALAVNDNLTIEQALQININNKPFTITMRTPGNDIELIRGLLYSEDIYRDNENLNIQLTENKEKSITEAEIETNPNLLKNGYSNSRSFLSVASCGICGKTELDDIDTSCTIEDSAQLNIDQLYEMFELMKEEQPTFKLSGGSHAASAFTIDGKLICTMEDIGRHNAVDKVIGYLVNNSLIKQAKCITVSGRISYEIVAKAFSAKIPILAAVSAPSTLAVDFAKELGITLLGFCRENKATCYSHPKRISSSN
jgi:FdhD protein